MDKSYIVYVIRLLLAVILGGIVGYEREHTKRPAGFRTHILVCAGSALVMVVSEFTFKKYIGFTKMDPARLGAQVISGIGFLGAGTIMREGSSVKGLTTAASLWIVSCIGLAVGAGFYSGAITATLITFFTLIFLKKMESRLISKKRYVNLYVQTIDKIEQIDKVKTALKEMSVTIKNIEFILKGDEDMTEPILKLRIKVPESKDISNIVTHVSNIDGVRKVYS